MRPLRVVVVGDDPLARVGLASVLESQDGLSVAARLGAGEESAAGARLPGFDVAVCDLAPTGRGGLDRLGELGLSGSPILALVTGAAQGREAWTAGARGVLFRDREPAALAAAVRAVSLGLTVLEPEVVEPGRRIRSAPPPLVEPLTPREVEVLGLLAEGLSNKEIASRLAISEHTAKFHVNAILGKLGAQSRTEALVQAARLGLVVI